MRINNSNRSYALNAYSQFNNTINEGAFEKNKKILKEATKDNVESFKEKDVSLVSKTDSEDFKIAREIEQLESYEKSVIEHERAHMLSGGSLAGSASYTYTLGPDGKRYISGGNVSMRLPQASSFDSMLRNLKRLKAASTAPHNPSPQDMQTLAMASAREASIKNEFRLKKATEAYEKQAELSLETENKEMKNLDPIDRMVKKTYTSALSRMKFETKMSFEMMV